MPLPSTSQFGPETRPFFNLLADPVRMRYAEWMNCFSGYHWVVDADLKGYFDSIPQEGLMERVGEKIADGRVLGLVEGMLHAGVMESVKGWQPTEKGTQQGAVISPLLSNIYLDGLDWKMA